MVRNLSYQRLVVVTGVVFCMTGCGHVISSEMRQVASGDLSFPVILENPTAFVGSSVILGGMIIETLYEGENTTIMMLETPLDSGGKPADEEYTRGRFIAVASGFLDGAIFRKGKKVALAGEIIGKDVRPLGDSYYEYPLVLIKEIIVIEDKVTPWYYPKLNLSFGYYFD